MTPDEQQKLQQISDLLDEAYKHYFTFDTHCKSQEAAISVYYGNLWERDGGPMTIHGLKIYSYVFCDYGRDQWFDTVDEALEQVKKWHADEMSRDYQSSEYLELAADYDRMAAEFIAKMSDRITYIELTEEDFK